ncbi:MAG TPA: HIRAN domain-containing protein [Gaiellaceae bacterium]|nr:HIRAN domain-containing protein [Gaiellaceae bacterium]
MGLFDRLFKKPSPQSVTPASDSAPLLVDLVDVPLGGDETLYVVGESYRQDALWQLVGGTREEGVRVECVAQLVPEPDNPHDRNAIAVFIKGEHVGYLSRSDAAAYLDGLTHLIKESPNGHVTLHGWICGGGLREDGLGRLGVFLDHDPEDFGVVDEPPPHRTLADLPKGYGFRTGFSEARSTDLEDDSYDLSWFDDLSQSVPTAIAQLKTLLATVDDPIDRHYMYAELEHRLYGARFAVASALEEYDEACRQHDAAMDEIRAALFAKFGRLPILDTYRQAGVRCQQAKDWQGARRWCERGIVLYGDDAAKPEFVDDLRKRHAHAIAKLEAADRPKPTRKPRQPQPARAQVVEALVCQVCGHSFERVRTQGRKPRACPTCRGAPQTV